MATICGLRRPATGDIMTLVDRLDPLGVDELDRVALLDRQDTKYLLNAVQLIQLLDRAAFAYQALEIDGTRLHAYETLYFDTPDLRLYRDHHAERPRRRKVRSRYYASTGAAFLEVKQRTGNGRTQKERLPVEPGACEGHLSEDALAWLEPHLAFPARLLQPALLTSFWRITLAGIEAPERVTLDLELRVSDGSGSRTFDGLVIAEVKEPRGGRRSVFGAAAREARLRPASFSKFCAGIATLREAVKHNNFKPSLRVADRVMEEAGQW